MPPRQPGEVIVLEVGWEGELARIMNINAAGSKDRTLPARPVLDRIKRIADRDQRFIKALAAGNAEAARARLEEIARGVLERGVPPKNADSTAARKGGDRRALRNERGADALYKGVRANILPDSEAGEPGP